MAEELLRLYRMEDEELITRAQTQKNALNDDITAFTARFPWLLAAYVTSYQTDIDTADAFPEDNTVMTDIKVLTADVNASVEEGKGNLKVLFLYSEITYPKDLVKQRVFGQDRMDKARSDQEKMMNLLEHAHSFANKAPYRTDLMAKGYTVVEIDALATVADNIRDKNRLQENAVASRPVTTQDRIMVYNTVFSRMLLIYKCAQVVFAGDPARIVQYRAYPPQEAGDTTTAQAHLTNATTGADMAGLTVMIVGTALSDISDAAGIASIELAASPPDSIDLEVSGADITTQLFEGLAIVQGEVNEFEIEVVV